MKSNTMNDPDSVIRDALAVRDDGAEPQFDADLYEQAILHEARLENSATETFAQVLARVASNGNDHVDALVFAAQRVRDREAAMGKAAAAPSPIAEDAQRAAKSGSSPRFRKSDYEDEMMKLAKAEARPGEGMAVAFARLCGEGRFDELYAAGERAEVAEVEAVLAKGVSRDERFDRMLLDLARMRKRAGESVERCASRLLHEDEVVMAAWASTQGM